MSWMTWRTGSTPGLHKYQRLWRLRLQASSLLSVCHILSSLELLRSLRLYSWDGSAVPVRGPVVRPALSVGLNQVDPAFAPLGPRAA